MTPPTSVVKSADRVLDLLELLCRNGNAASHTQLSRSLGIPKSSVTSLVRNLLARGFLEKSPDSGDYRLGPAFFGLLKRGRQARDVLKLARPQLVWLTEKTKEASAFYVFRGDHIERVLGEEVGYALNYRMIPRVTFPLYSAAAGKAVLNALPDDERTDYLRRIVFVPKTSKTARSASEIRKRLKAIGP